MSDDRLKEIFDSINLQMIVEQNIGYRNKYSPILTEEIDLYNAVIKYKELINKAIKHVSSLSSRGRDCMIYADVKKDILDILKEVEHD